MKKVYKFTRNGRFTETTIIEGDKIKHYISDLSAPFNYKVPRFTFRCWTGSLQEYGWQNSPVPLKDYIKRLKALGFKEDSTC